MTEQPGVDESERLRQAKADYDPELDDPDDDSTGYEDDADAEGEDVE